LRVCLIALLWRLRPGLEVGGKCRIARQQVKGKTVQNLLPLQSGRWNAESETRMSKIVVQNRIMVEQPHSSGPTEIQLPTP
jgi:hypothetical protein